MSSFLERISKLPPNKLALLAAELQARLEAEQAAHRQPIAIVGIGCRFPGGADSLEAFGELLAHGTDAISEVDAFRWNADTVYDANPDAPGKASSKWGGFLHGLDQFDAGFFGIAPREAERLDPQHRLLLEVAWEALETACISPASLAASNTGVFLGISNNDFGAMLLGMPNDTIDGYTASGAAHSIASGRLSYFLGLKGPSLTVDTACSSSGVALHLACQSLRRKECDLVLAGGVNVILLPETTIALSKSHMLASDGRCKTFSADADGFVRSEGCGLVVLKRLSEAQAAGDTILGVIRGTACNQDGRSSGLTAPNGPSQEAVIRAALKDAGLDAADIGYIEAHGTGTALGDPIEVGALAGIFAKGRSPEAPLVVGSVKSNVGHLESAAAIAGVAKVLAAFEREQIPPHLHAQTLNPHISWETLPLAIPHQAQSWLRSPQPRFAGVSSFGFSGTNVHLILEEPPLPLKPSGRSAKQLHPLVLSAKTPSALVQLRVRLSAYLAASPDLDWTDFCYSLATGRTHFAYRFAAIAGSIAEAQAALAAESTTPPVKVAPGSLQLSEGTIPAGALQLPDADWVNLLQTLTRLYQEGASIDWPALYAGETRRKLRLPTYPFERQRHWITSPRAASTVRDEWLYEVGWVPLPGASTSLPKPLASAEIAERVSRDAPDLAAWPELRGHQAFRAGIERLSLEYAVAALQELRFEANRVLPRHARLWTRLLALYHEAGGTAVEAAPPAPRLAALKQQFPQFGAELEFLEKAEHLPEVLVGQRDPLELLFPEGSLALTERLYQESPAARVYNALVAQTVSELVRVPRSSGKLRILEIGAGTGSTTAGVLPLLGSMDYEYVFTDVSTLFLAQAQTKFSAYPAVRFALLDIEHPGSQRNLGVFDIVIASNVLHATADLRVSLRHVRDLLAPGGHLVLLEGTRPQPFGDLTVGMTDGWWRFTDTDLRPNYPLLARRQWLTLLSQERFDAAALPVDQDLRDENASFWAEQSVFVAAVEPAPKTFVLVGDGDAAACATALRAAGHSATLFGPGQPLPSAAEPVTYVYFGLAKDGSAAEALRLSTGVLALLQSTVTARDTLFVVTERAQAVLPGEPVALPGSALWGLLRTAALERPEFRCHAVDVPNAVLESNAVLHVLIALLTGPLDPAERQIAIRQDQRFVARLMPPALRLPQSPDLSGAHLLTGAYGGLGPALAQWLAAAGAQELFLVGRRAPSTGVRASLLALEKQGVRVHLLEADVASRSELARIFSDISKSAHPLRGIFHLAGSLRDKTIQQQDAASFREVFAAKVTGALLLDEFSRNHTPPDPLSGIRHFVLFGSAASIMGSAGQANHAASNACLDALAYCRRGEGLPALSIAWGPWADIGAAVAYSAERGEARGVSLIPPADGLALLGALLGRENTQVAVLPIDWRPYLHSMVSAPTRFFDKLAVSFRFAKQPQPAAEAILPADFASLRGEERTASLQTYVLAQVRLALRLPADAVIALDEPLAALGLDSLMALELKNNLQTWVGATLPPDLFFQYPTVYDVVTYLEAVSVGTALSLPSALLEEEQIAI